MPARKTTKQPTKQSKKVAKKVVRRKRGGRGPLDRGKAVAALSKGATAAVVAKAAGSKAAKRSDLARVGRKLIRQLQQRGVILETFAEEKVDVRAFCKHVVKRMNAKHVKVFMHKGKPVYSKELIDWDTQTRAAEQFMRATGMLSLPLEPGEDEGGSLDGLNDELAGEIAGLLAEMAGEKPQRGA